MTGRLSLDKTKVALNLFSEPPLHREDRSRNRIENAAEGISSQIRHRLQESTLTTIDLGGIRVVIRIPEKLDDQLFQILQRSLIQSQHNRFGCQISNPADWKRLEISLAQRMLSRQNALLTQPGRAPILSSGREFSTHSTRVEDPRKSGFVIFSSSLATEAPKARSTLSICSVAEEDQSKKASFLKPPSDSPFGSPYSSPRGSPTNLRGNRFQLLIPSVDESIQIEEEQRLKREEGKDEATSPVILGDEEVYVKALKMRYAIDRPSQKPSKILVVGHKLTSQEKQLCQLARQSIAHSQNKELDLYIRDHIGLKRLVRGTYIIHHMSKEKISTLTAMMNVLVFKEETRPPLQVVQRISEYLWGDYSVPVAIFKPEDEVRGGANSPYRDYVKLSKDGIKPSCEIPNELIVAGITHLCVPTMQTSLTSDQFNLLRQPLGTMVTKDGMLQAFISNATSLNRLSKEQAAQIAHNIQPAQLQKLALIDLAFCNTDRTGGNVMVYIALQQLEPIDHALVLPANFGSKGTFIWMTWAASHAPFTKRSLKRIGAMNFSRDLSAILQAYPEYPEENLEVMEICYYLLKKGAKAKLTPFQIGLFYRGQPSYLMSLYSRVRYRYQGNPTLVIKFIKENLDRAISLMAKEAVRARKNAGKYGAGGSSESNAQLLEQRYNQLFEKELSLLH